MANTETNGNAAAYTVPMVKIFAKGVILIPCNKIKRGGFAREELPEELRIQLDFLDDAQYHLLLILVGIILQFGILDVQRETLLTSTFDPDHFDKNDFPDPFAMQVVASVVTLYALLGFYQQGQSVVTQTEAAGADACPAEISASLNLIVILVALVRFGLLLDTQTQAAQAEETPLELEATIDEI